AGVNNDPNNDGNTASDRSPYTGRNTITGPNFAEVNMRFSRDIHIWERASLRLMFEAFNLTNRANYSSSNATHYLFAAAHPAFVTNPVYLSRTATFDPRILQLSAKFTF